jgi:hypothetical protein
LICDITQETKRGVKEMTRRELEEEREEEEEEEGEEESFELPASLPPPPRLQHGAKPIFSTVFGLIAAVLAGAVLYGFVHATSFYIYVIYNVFLAFVVGKAIGVGLRLDQARNSSRLVLIASVGGLLSYFVYHASMYVYLGSQNPKIFQEVNLFQFLWLKAGLSSFLDLKLGAYGMSAVWIAEALFTLWLTTAFVDGEVEAYELSLVPVEVQVFVLNCLAQEWGRAEIAGELDKRGWGHPEDQALAFRSADILIARAAQAQQQG